MILSPTNQAGPVEEGCIISLPNALPAPPDACCTDTPPDAGCPDIPPESSGASIENALYKNGTDVTWAILHPASFGADGAAEGDLLKMALTGAVKDGRLDREKSKDREKSPEIPCPKPCLFALILDLTLYKHKARLRLDRNEYPYDPYEK